VTPSHPVSNIEPSLVYNNRSDRWEKGYSLYEIPEINRSASLRVEPVPIYRKHFLL